SLPARLPRAFPSSSAMAGRSAPDSPAPARISYASVSTSWFESEEGDRGRKPPDSSAFKNQGAYAPRSPRKPLFSLAIWQAPDTIHKTKMFEGLRMVRQE